ncbi:hypothetical protein [Phenylobacterium sp. J367]|uniref:hypothetical protein n=1 Tax=Phenylobacterium sp. J367 TaxID=2898435 RepID=UPI002151CAEE|nr:hypothetical protein [Phenylobacterium sp. J367]MCR5880925.1 hypothetical protein [Phenylobacterium sp. J367]
MTEPAATTSRDEDAPSIARRFVAARQAFEAVPGFPGPLPRSLAEGYRIQEAAIGLWPDEVAGWKIGKVPVDVQAEVGETRLAGPIFRANVQTPPGGGRPLPNDPGRLLGRGGRGGGPRGQGRTRRQAGLDAG